MEMCDAARDLAELGYPVFPCRPDGKAPLTRHGFKQATRDERQILQWWDTWPDANIGIACGAAGIAVVDIDAKAGGDPAEIIAGLNLNGDIVVARTGEAPPVSDQFPESLEGVRGAHVYFRAAVRTGPLNHDGVELRANGAYVVAAPSLHPSGVRYEWHGRDLPPPVAALPKLPPGLHPHRAVKPPAIHETMKLGRRHDGLKDIAIDLVRRGITAEDLLAGALLEANRCRCQPPKSPEEVRLIARWAAGSQLSVRAAAASYLSRVNGQEDRAHP
jgi:hypothetical protein